MKNTIQKSVDILNNVVTKYIVIKDKINENVLNQQSYQQLVNRLNNLLDNVGAGDSGGDSESNPEWYYLTVSGFSDTVDGVYELIEGDESNGDFGSCKWMKRGGGMYLGCPAVVEWEFTTEKIGGTFAFGAIRERGYEDPWECNWGEGKSITLGDSGSTDGKVNSYIVSGCGLLYFDGEYTYAGEYNGKPYYTRIYKPSAALETTYTYYLSYRSDTSGWGITDQLEGAVTPYYYQSTVSQTPDSGVYAVVSGKGNSPAPTVTKITSTGS